MWGNPLSPTLSSAFPQPWLPGSLKLFPVFWTTPLSEEPWPAGLVGLRPSVNGVPAQHTACPTEERPEALQQHLCVKHSAKQNRNLYLHKLVFLNVSVPFRLWLIILWLTKQIWFISHTGSGLRQLPWSYMISLVIRANQSCATWRFGEGSLDLNITQRQKHLFLRPPCCLF